MKFPSVRDRIPGSDAAWLLAWRMALLGLALAILFVFRSNTDEISDLASTVDELNDTVGEVREIVSVLDR